MYCIEARLEVSQHRVQKARSIQNGVVCIEVETRLHSGEGTVGFEMVGDLFILAFEDLRKAGVE